MYSIRQAIVYLLRHDTVNRTVQGSGTATKQSPSFIVIDRRGNYRPYQAILSRGGGDQLHSPPLRSMSIGMISSSAVYTGPNERDY